MVDDVSTTLADILQHPGRAFPAIAALTLMALFAIVSLHLALTLVGGARPSPVGVSTVGRNWSISEPSRVSPCWL